MIVYRNLYLVKSVNLAFTHVLFLLEQRQTGTACVLL